MKNLPLRVYFKLQGFREALVDESGQDLIEYALVVSLIALAATAGMGTVATKIGSAFNNVSNKLGTYTS